MNRCPFWYDGDRVGGFFTLRAAFGVFFGVGWFTPPSWWCGGCRCDVLGRVDWGVRWFAVDLGDASGWEAGGGSGCGEGAPGPVNGCMW